MSLTCIDNTNVLVLKVQCCVFQLNEDLLPIVRPTEETNGLTMASSPVIMYSQQHMDQLSELGFLNNSSVDSIRVSQVYIFCKGIPVNNNVTLLLCIRCMFDMQLMALNVLAVPTPWPMGN